MFAEMAKYHEELQKAGVLLDASASRPARRAGASNTPARSATVVDGPFAEAKGVDRGLHDDPGEVEGRGDGMGPPLPQSALDGKDGEIEVRQLFELDDFGPERSGGATSASWTWDEAHEKIRLDGRLLEGVVPPAPRAALQKLRKTVKAARPSPSPQRWCGSWSSADRAERSQAVTDVRRPRAIEAVVGRSNRPRSSPAHAYYGRRRHGGGFSRRNALVAALERWPESVCRITLAPG